MNIAIIPARGGSKRIPRKNIRDFCGKPMISYAITAAIESGLFQHIVVSTEDEEIAEIAGGLGAEIPFVRPVELADDHTATVPVIAHAIQACHYLGWQFDRVCCIYPGVPFIQIDDLIGAFERIREVDLNYSFPITEYPSAVQRALRIIGDGRTQPFYPDFSTIRTQDLEPSYYDAGQFYWGSAKTWLSGVNIHSNGYGYVIPNWRVIDIDTLDDWKRAELIYQSFNSSNISNYPGKITYDGSDP